MDDAASAFFAVNQSIRYFRKVVRTTRWPETSSCGRSKTRYTRSIVASSLSPSRTPRHLERLLTICVLRCDPALPAIFITETSCPKLRFRMSPNARHPITKLITSSSIQAFPRRLTLSESSRIKLFLDLSGRRHRKQGSTPLASRLRPG